MSTFGEKGCRICALTAVFPYVSWHIYLIRVCSKQLLQTGMHVFGHFHLMRYIVSNNLTEGGERITAWNLQTSRLDVFAK